MSERLDPTVLFNMIDHYLPVDLKPNVLVVGSLAAAYHFRSQLHLRGITTKDADCVIHPAGAVEECREIAERLLAAGWYRTAKCRPQTLAEPHDTLWAIRLYPPSTEAFFIELLAFPNAEQRESKVWLPCKLSDGWYGLPSFRFLGLVGHGWKTAENGLNYAAPEMMALANLLSHPRVGTETMGELIGGRELLRSAKDLGRVLAIAWFTGREGTELWMPRWEEALRTRFGAEAGALAESVGSGLRELLADPGALDEARHAVDVGLLNGKDVTLENLRVTGQRLLVDVIQPLAQHLGGRASS